MIANAVAFLNTHPKLLAVGFVYCVFFLLGQWWKVRYKKKHGEFDA